MTVVANDSDVHVILVYRAVFTLREQTVSPVYLKSDVTRQKHSGKSDMSIRDVCLKIGDAVARTLPVVHAVSGCDDTT
jgi:hypothetical protein